MQRVWFCRRKPWTSGLFTTKGRTGECGLVHGPRAKIIISGIPNRTNYCLLFIEYTQLTDVAAGSIIQPGEMHSTCGPRVACVGHCVSIVFRTANGTKEVPKHVADFVSIVFIVQCI